MPRLFLILLLSLAPTATAITIAVAPPSQIVFTGSVATVDIVITGLGDLTAPSLGAYQLTVGFDPAILAVSGVTFGDPVLGDQLDLGGVGTLTGWSLLLPDLMEFNETSFDSESTLDSGQAGSFTLATLSFDTLGLGTSPLTLGIDSLSDASGLPLVADTLNGSITAVPEPAAWLLLGPGFAALWLRRRGMPKL